MTAYLKREKVRYGFEILLMTTICTASLIYVLKFSSIKEVSIFWMNEVGPAIYLLSPLAVILLTVIFLSSLGRLDDRFPSAEELLMIKEYAPVLGMLGTVMGLVFSLGNYDLSQDLQFMIQSVISGLLKALISTAVGIVLGVTAGNIYDRLFADQDSKDNLKKNDENTGDLWALPNSVSFGEKLRSKLFSSSKSKVIPAEGVSEKIEKASGVSPFAREKERQKVITDLKNALRVFCFVVNVVVECKIGPSVYQISIRLSEGSRLSAIEKSLRDIARRIGVDSLRLVETGKPSTVLIEVPREKREYVSLQQVINLIGNKEEYSKPTVFPLGLKQTGEPVICDFKEMPHLLIGGTTQSGKTSLLDSIIAGLILKAKPDELRLSLIDLKNVSFQKYKNIPHLLGDVATTVNEATKILNSLVTVMENRKEVMAREKATNIEEFNDQSGRRLPYVVIIIDEYGALAANSDHKHLSSLIKLASQGAACGIHLIIATQRPDYRVVDKRVEANIPGRIALKVSAALESRIILGVSGAEKLRGQGDLLYKSSDGIVRVQGCYISNDDVRKLVITKSSA